MNIEAPDRQEMKVGFRFARLASDIMNIKEQI